MKNVLKLLGIAAIITVIGTETAHAQTINLDVAIQRLAMELSAGIERGSRITVAEVEADSTAMSNYLISELNIAFMLMGFTAVDRSQLDMAGHGIGVQFIVSGTFASHGDFYQFRAQISETETGSILRIHTAHVRHDIVIAALLGTAERGMPAAPAAASRENWISAEFAGGSGFGVTVRYERDLSNFFSLGGTGSFFHSDTFTYFGAMLVTRLFLGGSPFFLELGLGGAYAAWEYTVRRWTSWGFERWTRTDSGFAFLMTPAIGVRLGGQRAGFFATPFISLPLAFGDFDTETRFQFGIAVGGAW